MKKFTVTLFSVVEGKRVSKKAGVFTSKGLALRVAKAEAKALGPDFSPEAYISGNEKTRFDKEERAIFDASYNLISGLTVY